MVDQSWQATREYVRNRAASSCEYCQTCELNIGQTLHVEHIIPDSGNHSDNLCLACPNCNLSKATATTSVDPETGQEVSLFNPRQQSWSQHFHWIDDYSKIEGISPFGRATVLRLRMNRSRIVLARQRWVQAGLHPPQEI